MMIVPLLLIGLLIYWVYNLPENNKSNKYNFGENDAINILNNRYANGEISTDEYIKKKSILNY